MCILGAQSQLPSYVSEKDFGSSPVSLSSFLAMHIIWVAIFLSCCGVCHWPMVPRRNLGPHMCCSHMLVPLGARWYLGPWWRLHGNLFSITWILCWLGFWFGPKKIVGTCITFWITNLHCRVCIICPYAHHTHNHVHYHYTSWIAHHQAHHNQCIMSCASFHQCMGHLIRILHHCKHTSHVCIN